MLKASEWIYYYNYDRSHDGLRGKRPIEALREIDPKLPKDILFLPPIILDDRITFLGGGTEVYRHYKACRLVSLEMRHLSLDWCGNQIPIGVRSYL